MMQAKPIKQRLHSAQISIQHPQERTQCSG